MLERKGDIGNRRPVGHGSRLRFEIVDRRQSAPGPLSITASQACRTSGNSYYDIAGRSYGR